MIFNIRLITIFYVITLIFGDWINFSIDYFRARHVTFVCLLACERDASGYHHFVKYASIQNVAVSSCYIDKEYPKYLKDLDLCLKQTASSTGVIINPKCPDFEKIMYHASENVLLDSKHKWLIIEEKETEKKDKIMVNEADDFDGTFYNDTEFVNKGEVGTIGILSNLNLSIDADITLSIKLDNSSYKLYEVYNFGKQRNGKFVIESVGNWNNDKGLNILKECKYYRRWDFQQMVFRIEIVLTPIPPKFDPRMIDLIPDHRVSKITQTSTMILQEITGIHNFRYNYSVSDRWVGDYVKGHKVKYLYLATAVTNALYFREADVTPILRFLRDHFDRYDVAPTAVTYIETRFYYRIPSQGVGKYENQFLRPLSRGAWWCVLGVCALCCVVLLLSAVVENRPINVYCWCYSVFSVFALICQQFFEEFEDMRRISAARKATILVTGLACLLLYNYYTSSVVSWLLNGPPPSINSLWELIDSPLQPMFEDVGYTYSWLQLPDYYFNKKKSKAEDQLKRKLNTMIKKGKTVVAPVNVGIELVRRGGYAFHAETNGANARISRTFNPEELCDLDSLHSMEKIYLYTCVPKNSPYREFFSWSLARLQERGVIQCIHERTWTREPKCEGSSPRALALGGAAPAFIVLAGGFALGTAIMLVERVWWKYNLKNRKPLRKIKKEDWWNDP